MASKAWRDALLAAFGGGVAQGANKRLQEEREFARELAKLQLQQQAADAENELRRQEGGLKAFMEGEIKAKGYTTATGDKIPGLPKETVGLYREQAKKVYGDAYPNIDPLAPTGATPPPQGAGGMNQKQRETLATNALQSINDVSNILEQNPSILTELKIARNDPTGLFEQAVSSPKAKEFLAKLRTGVSNQLYIKSGATANPSEITENMRNYLTQISDKDDDQYMRLDLLDREVRGFISKNSPALKIMSPSQQRKHNQLIKSQSWLTPEEQAELNQLAPGAKVRRAY